MPPRYWMISNRKTGGDSLGSARGPLTYWTSQSEDLDTLANWQKETAATFRASVVDAVRALPSPIEAGRQEEQAHLTLFIHGYNNDWRGAVHRYQQIVGDLYTGPQSLGVCLLFTWPSEGCPAGYLPDRLEAQASAPDLTEILSQLYDWLLDQQEIAARAPDKQCRTKVSVIAHSMGNYVLQKAMQYTWTRKNRPLLVSLVNQLVMVAADVDNDLFGDGERTTGTDGDAVSNLTYRITALFSGLDQVLGMSAGLKHFGKRRLGRSGLDRTSPLPDNVWDLDCTQYFGGDGGMEIHSAYFKTAPTLDLMRRILRGVDRGVIAGQVDEG
jgi:esterase/lipase superfamily enzyme